MGGIWKIAVSDTESFEEIFEQTGLGQHQSPQLINLPNLDTLRKYKHCFTPTAYTLVEKFENLKTRTIRCEPYWIYRSDIRNDGGEWKVKLTLTRYELAHLYIFNDIFLFKNVWLLAGVSIAEVKNVWKQIKLYKLSKRQELFATVDNDNKWSFVSTESFCSAVY